MKEVKVIDFKALNKRLQEAARRAEEAMQCLPEMYCNSEQAKKLLEEFCRSNTNQLILSGCLTRIFEGAKRIQPNWESRGGIPIYLLETDLGLNSHSPVSLFGGRSTPPDLDMMDKW